MVRGGRKEGLRQTFILGGETPSQPSGVLAGGLSAPFLLSKASHSAVLTPVPALMTFQPLASPDLCQGKYLARLLASGSDFRAP